MCVCVRARVCCVHWGWGCARALGLCGGARVLWACVYVCVCVINERILCFCKRSGLLRDGVP